VNIPFLKLAIHFPRVNPRVHECSEVVHQYF
jgi:hypothetical protein